MNGRAETVNLGRAWGNLRTKRKAGRARENLEVGVGGGVREQDKGQAERRAWLRAAVAPDTREAHNSCLYVVLV